MEENKTTARGRGAATAKAATKKAAPKSAAISQAADYNITRKKKDKARQLYIFLTKSKGGIYFSIPQNNITIYDEETNSVRQIRYCPNENSIFVDEQSPNALREHVVFRNGMLAVKHTNPPLIKFLQAHPGNTANGGNLFYLKDEAKTAVDEVENEFAMHDAVGLVREKAIEELYPIAMYLNINIEAEPIAIKRELLRHAKANPATFIKMFDNPSVKTRSAIMQAVDFQILENTPSGMRWFDTGGLITSTPIGQDTIDVMTRFCLTEKGSEVFAEITNRLESIA